MNKKIYKVAVALNNGIEGIKFVKVEDEYAELNHYDEELEKKLEHTKEMEEFYSELARKLQEVL